MKEYIERASLMGALTSGTEQLAMREMTGAEAYAEFVRLVNFVPAANVVEVVRCRECEHWKDWGACGHPDNGWDAPPMGPEDFCSRGERKTDGN